MAIGYARESHQALMESQRQKGPEHDGAVIASSVSSPNMRALEPFVGPAEASKFVRLHPGTVQRLARTGNLPGHPVGDGRRRRWRFRLSELGQWLESRGSGTVY